MEQKIEPRQVRDFGEIINDTFVFAFQNWKPLLRAYAVICGAFVVGGTIATILQNFRMIKGIRSFGGQRPLEAFTSILGVEYIFSLLFTLLIYTSVNLTVLAFIHLYKEKGKEVPTTEEVWEYVKFYFFKFLGSGILLGILGGVAFMFLFIPGIYLMPVFSIIFPIMMMESLGFGAAFSKAFRLIKNNWWTTFGVQIIMLIVVFAASALFTLPLTFTGLSTSLLGMSKSPALAIVLSSVLSHLAMVFMILPCIAVALCYYSVSEQHEGLGLIERIQDLGKEGTGTPEIQEEY